MNILIKLVVLVLTIHSSWGVDSDSYIDLNSSQLKEIEYYSGKNFTFYNEYKPKIFEDRVSFPIRCCDPLPIHNMGDLRVFFISAVDGNLPRLGESVIVPDSDVLTQILVIRAKTEYGRWLQIYIGYNPENYNTIGGKKIYKAQLLALLTKNSQHIEDVGSYLFSGTILLSNQFLGLEIRKLLLNPIDWNFNNPQFISILESFVPKEGKFVLLDQNIYLTESYWTKKENKLKKTLYKGLAQKKG